MGQIIIVLTDSAYSDLVDIENYISKDSPIIARKFVNKIFDKIDLLQNFSELGKPVPEIPNKNIRELIIKKYRIIYQLKDESCINIIRIIHGSRLVDIEY